jgi:hypothetical protein
MSLDHKIPRRQGGTRAPENVVPACWNCNQEKGDMTLEEYRAMLSNKRGMPVIFHGERLNGDGELSHTGNRADAAQGT